ncbi:MAG: YbeD family protein [Burkholderiaceae bacterium]
MTTAEAPPPGGQPPGLPDSARTELLSFPTAFPLKVMGLRVDGFAEAIVSVVQKHAPDFDAASLEMRPSRQGTYLGLTATIRATSRQQLDALYLELTAHPMVKVVL